MMDIFVEFVLLCLMLVIFGVSLVVVVLVNQGLSIGFDIIVVVLVDDYVVFFGIVEYVDGFQIVEDSNVDCYLIVLIQGCGDLVVLEVVFKICVYYIVFVGSWCKIFVLKVKLVEKGFVDVDFVWVIGLVGFDFGVIMFEEIVFFILVELLMIW